MRIRPTDIDPGPDGTTIKEVDATGTPTGKQWVTVHWSIRNQEREEGSLQWIDRIVIGDTLTAARSNPELAGEDTALASSSISSRDVTAIRVGLNGETLEEFTVPYVLVGKANKKVTPEGPPPVAAELWFSNEPFDSAVEENAPEVPAAAAL